MRANRPRPKSLTNRVIVAVLRSHLHWLLSAALLELRFNGRRTRRLYSMPAQYARLGDDLVLYPGRPSQKVWWRNFEEPDDVTIMLAGREEQRKAHVLRPGDLKYDAAREVYASRFKRITIPPENPLVLLTA